MTKLACVVFALVLLVPSLATAQATTFSVNTTDDTDDGACNLAHCSLREAITAANGNFGTDTISFAIAAPPGVRRIEPTSTLPTITDPVVVDGTTQPGFAGSPLVELSGNSAGAGVPGLRIAADSCDVRGIAIRGFSDGILLDGGAHNTIGGIAASESNVISGNSSAGVRITRSAASGNSVQWNTITDNDGAGIALFQAGDGNVISFNSIFDNGGLGIDLGDDGHTQNDAGDGDSGPNGLQNYPDLNKVVFGFNRAEGSLNTSPDTEVKLEFFTSTVCDASGYGEGETVVGGTMITTDVSGDADFAFTLQGNIPLGEYVAVTATDADGNTSEFSRCVPATTFSVTISPDSGLVYRGGSDDYAVFVTPEGGSCGQTITMSCSNLPGLTTCEFSPESFTLDTAEVRSNLIVRTTKLAAAEPPAEPGAPARAAWLALAGFALPVVLLLRTKAWGRRAWRGRLFLPLLLAAGLLSISLYAACGNEDTTGVVEAGTPRGKHTFVVNANSESLLGSASAILVVK